MTAYEMRISDWSSDVCSSDLKMFNWAVERDILDASPVAGIQPPGAETSRDRVLSDDEISWFWKGCEEIGAPFGPLFKLLLVTAKRRGEGRAMTTGQLDLGERLWTIPGKIATNGQPHVVPLTPQAVEVLKERRRGAWRDRGVGSVELLE